MGLAVIIEAGKRKKPKANFVPDEGLIALLQDLDGVLYLKFDRGDRMPVFNPQKNVLKGGFYKIKYTLEAAGIPLPTMFTTNLRKKKENNP